jgi:hypothetical protein
MTCFVTLAVVGGLVIVSPADEPKVGLAKGKPNPARLKGMKAAVVDIEAGKLKLKSRPLPDPPWHDRYVELLTNECGVEWETVKGTSVDRIAEIEFRFGKGIIEKLQEKAQERPAS